MHEEKFAKIQKTDTFVPQRHEVPHEHIVPAPSTLNVEAKKKTTITFAKSTPMDSFQVRGELSELAIEVRRIEQERDDARATNVRLRASIAQLESALRREHPASMLANVQDLEHQLSQLHSRIRSAQRELQDRDDAIAFAKSDAAHANAALADALDASKERESSLRNRILSLESALGELKSQLAVAVQQRDAALRQVAESRDRIALAQIDADEQLALQRDAVDERRAVVSSQLLAAAKKRKLDQFVSSLGDKYAIGDKNNDNDVDDDDDDDAVASTVHVAPSVSSSTPGSVLAGIRNLLGGYVAAFKPVSDPFSLFDAEAAALARAETAASSITGTLPGAQRAKRAPADSLEETRWQ
jgi:predicted  nucleic acid-binding Zn-ribbon protein